jgi:hypothetical protein
MTSAFSVLKAEASSSYSLDLECPTEVHGLNKGLLLSTTLFGGGGNTKLRVSRFQGHWECVLEADGERL